jgi:hypothetical protein
LLLLIQRCRWCRRQSWGDRLVLIEALAWLGIARFAVGALPFHWIASYLGHRQRESPAMADPGQQERVRRIGRAVVTMSRHTPWESQCLVQAIAAKMMLRRRGVPSTLYLGVTKDDATGLSAHAWVRSGDVVLTGAAGRERFTVIATFAETVERTGDPT